MQARCQPPSLALRPPSVKWFPATFPALPFCGHSCGVSKPASAVSRVTGRLWFVDACMLLLEVLLVWWPMWWYLGSTSASVQIAETGRQGLVPFLLRAGPAVVVLLEVPWWIAVGPRRAALVRAMTIRNSGRPLPSDLRRRVGVALKQLPIFGLWLRALLVGAGAAGLLQLAALRGSASRELVDLLSLVAFGHAFCASVVRALWYERLLDRREARLFPDDDAMERLGHRFGRRVQLQSLATGVLGILLVVLYSLVFVPLAPTLYAELELLLTIVGFALLGLWMGLVPRFAAPIDRYFRDRKAAPEAIAKPLARTAYRASSQLPLWMALAKLGGFLAAIATMLALSTRYLTIDREEAGLLGGAALLIAMAVALYEALLQRASLRPLRVHLSVHHRLALTELGGSLSLGGKMVASFGLLAVFLAGISLYLSFVHYKAMATGFIQRETELRLSTVVHELATRDAGPEGPLTDAAIHDELRRFASELDRSVEEPALVYLPRDGKPLLYFGHGSELATLAPPLDQRLGGTEGRIDLPSKKWSGWFTTLTLRGEPRGKLALLQPGYRGRGASTVPQVRLLVITFLLMIAGAIGIVLVAARDLTAPLRTLEARAIALANGDLGRAIPPSGEADEVGRLSLLLEEMRLDLNDRLRSSTEINVALEQEVAKRTGELEGRNRELADTLDALRRAQDELVRAEKLASMGRLVAGIAHEINNPVNAIANTAGPLDQALAQLRSGTAPDEAELADLRQMLSVIQRGARRTSEIVQALHSYSRRDDEKVSDVELARVLDETLDLLRHPLKSIKVDKHYAPGLVVRGNAGQLGQVFMNLVTNAAQAIEETGHGGTIRLRTEALPAGGAVVEISDDGPGMTEEVRQRIFDPFFTTKEVGKGSGLGLSIVQSLVDRHGGTVRVESRTDGPTHGTTFRVELPATTITSTTIDKSGKNTVS